MGMRIDSPIKADDLIESAIAAGKTARRNFLTKKSIEKDKREKGAEIERMKAMTTKIVNRLEKIVDGTSKVDELSPFLREITDVVIGRDQLKKSLYAISQGSRIADAIGNEYVHRLRLSMDRGTLDKFSKEGMGRLMSVVKKLRPHLEFICQAYGKAKRIPDIDEDANVYVVAGMPNVGKSSFIRTLTGSKIEVAEYPFTTKQLFIGTLEINLRKHLFIDTPGLLDRPLEERNKIELQAILALKHLADKIIFLVDPSGTCGYPFDEQLELYAGIKQSFKNEMITLISKADLLDAEQMRDAKKKLKGAVEVVAIDEGSVRKAFEEHIISK